MDTSFSHLMTLPEEVMYKYLFPFLRLNDLLRLRHVCKLLKGYSDGFIRNQCTTYEREINETAYSFSWFAQQNFPTSKIFLNNSGIAFFENPDMSAFLEKYGPKITHLRVNEFFTCDTFLEYQFYSALPNITHLEFNVTQATVSNATYFPANFKNIRSLIFHQMVTPSGRTHHYYYDFVRFCDKLQHLKYPDFENVEDNYLDPECHPIDICGEVITKQQRYSLDGNSVPFKSYDLETFAEQGLCSIAYLNLSKLCWQCNVKLLNVDSFLFNDLDDLYLVKNFDFISKPLVSVVNVHGFMFIGELPNLQKLTVNSIKKCAFDLIWFTEQPQWPALQEIDLNIDAKQTQFAARFLPENSEEFFGFLFGSVQRKKLTKLKITFDRYGTWEKSEKLPCPKMWHITQNCQNLKVLTLWNWQGTNKNLSKLWEGLPRLEEVALKRCPLLGNVAFVGEEKENPTFLKLANLKKLRLLDLDLMPKVTDLIFNLVFKFLKLKEFQITTANLPLSSVTVDGIMALAGGPFNQSIERFPFENWSLENVPEDEFRTLGRQFRSFYLI